MIYVEECPLMGIRTSRLSFKPSLAFLVFAVCLALAGCKESRSGRVIERSRAVGTALSTDKKKANMGFEVVKKDEEWRRILTPEQYRITRKKETEKPFSGKYNNFKGKGAFTCVCCGNLLFNSEDKFDSGSGWPSFFASAKAESIREVEDRSHGMVRQEVVCNRCGAHLGHVFDDGPRPTGLRYCINSAALDLEETKEPEKR